MIYQTIKILTLFQKLESFSIRRMVSAESIGKADLVYWRARILFLLIFTGLFIGLFVMIPVTILAVKQKMWGLLIFDVLVWLSGVGLIISRRLGYWLRAGIVLLAMYGVGLVVILSVGPLSGGPAWLFAFAVLVSVFLGLKAVLVALSLNTFTLAVTSWLMKTGVYGHTFPFFSSNAAMVSAGANFMLLNIMVALAVDVLVRGLVSTHQKEMALTGALEQEHVRLLESKSKIESEIEERKQTEELLKTSEKRYRFLADNVADNIWTMDMNLNFTYVSPSVKRIRGYSPEEAIAQRIEEIMPPASYEIATTALVEELDAHGKGQKPPERPRKVIVELYCIDGSSVWCEVEANFIYNSAGEPSGIIGVTRDITERKLTAEQLLRSEKLATLGDMVAGVAHEISTPLSVGLISASFLADKTEEFETLLASQSVSSPEIAKCAQKIKEASTMVMSNLGRAADLLNSFKNVAVDQMVEGKRRFNIRSNLEDTVNSLRPKYRRTDHSIIINCPDDLEIESFPGAFSQITTNLIINSMIHGFENQVRGTILINIEKTTDNLVYTFRDNGKGMDEITMNKLFDPFYTTKRNRGGMGLGMHVVYNLITQTLQGRIEFKSELGVGTEFIITIPVDMYTIKC